MEIGSRLRKRWYLVILAAIIALLVGATAVFKISHKGLKVNRTVYRVGIGQLLVDTNPSQLTNITGGAGALGGRAALIAQYSTGPQVVDQIAKLAGVPLASLTVEAQTTSATKTGGSASKNLGTVGAGTETVLLRTSGQAQTITITSQAKKSPLAKSLVTATMRAMTRSLRHLQNSEAFNHPAPVTTSSTTSSSSSSTTTTTTTTDIRFDHRRGRHGQVRQGHRSCRRRVGGSACCGEDRRARPGRREPEGTPDPAVKARAPPAGGRPGDQGGHRREQVEGDRLHDRRIRRAVAADPRA